METVSKNFLDIIRNHTFKNTIVQVENKVKINHILSTHRFVSYDLLERSDRLKNLKKEVNILIESLKNNGLYCHFLKINGKSLSSIKNITDLANLKSLVLHGKTDNLDQFKYLTNLESLTIDFLINDKNIDNILLLSNLTKLSLNKNVYGDSSLDYSEYDNLAIKLPKLKTLKIGRDIFFKNEIRKLTSLTNLDIKRNETIVDDDIENLTNLRSLSLEWSGNFSNSIFTKFNLHKLKIDYSIKIENIGIDNLKNLTKLTITGIKIKDNVVNFLNKLGNLFQLKLSYCTIKTKKLSRLSNISHLVLENCSNEINIDLKNSPPNLYILEIITNTNNYDSISSSKIKITK